MKSTLTISILAFLLFACQREISDEQILHDVQMKYKELNFTAVEVQDLKSLDWRKVSDSKAQYLEIDYSCKYKITTDCYLTLRQGSTSKLAALTSQKDLSGIPNKQDYTFFKKGQIIDGERNATYINKSGKWSLFTY